MKNLQKAQRVFGTTMISLALILTFTSAFSACRDRDPYEEHGTYVFPDETETQNSSVPASGSDPEPAETEEESAPTSTETDYSVEGWLSRSDEKNTEKALVALLKARSELVKERDLGDWYDLRSGSISVSGPEGTTEISDPETIAAITALLSPEKLSASVAVPEILNAVKNPSKEFVEETTRYGSYSGGDSLLLDFHNGVVVGVLYGPDNTERTQTGIRIGKSGRLNEGMIEIPSEMNPDIPFLYDAGGYITGREIEALLQSVLK